MPKKIDDFTLTRKTSLSFPYFELRNITDGLSSLIKSLPKGDIQVVYVDPGSGKKFVVTKFSTDIRRYMVLFKTSIEMLMHFSENECVEIKTPEDGLNVAYRIKMEKGVEADAYTRN